MTILTKLLMDGLMFPEAPRWHDGKLWFTDQHARRLIRVDLKGDTETLVEMDDLPGGIGWLPDGRLLMVSMTRRAILVLDNNRLKTYADLHDLASFHCNDMVVDHVGNAYVGNFGYDLHAGEPQVPTNLLRIDQAGGRHVVARDLVFPNGMVITPDGASLIVAETFASRLTAFSITDDGSLIQRRLWADVGTGFPDGICLDAAGAIWVALPNRGEVLRLQEGGQVLQRIKPIGRPYACMLGGESRRTLFIATSETDVPEEARESKSGRIEMVEVEVPGQGLP